MKKIGLFATAIILSVGLSGCVISVDPDGVERHHPSWQNDEQRNREYIAELTPNMSLTRVKDKLGIPDFNEYYERNGQPIQVLFYRTHRKKGDGVITKDECTALIFKQGQLISWGETAYQQL